MIELKDFSIGFKDRELLETTDTLFGDATLTALIGRNGTGKSTLLKAICGLNDKYRGEILIDGENIRRTGRGRLAKILAYVNTQRPRVSNMKCRDIVALGRTPYTGWDGKLTHRDREAVDKAIELVGMQDFSDRYFHSLSDGESQKIMIARAIAQDTPNIVLDEPTSFLDLPTRYELVNLLRKLAREERKCVVYSTHELDVARKLSDHIALVENKRLVNLPTAEMETTNFLSKLINFEN